MSRGAGAVTERHDRWTTSILMASRMAERMGQRGGLHGANVEDFVGWVRLRLLENDRAILRRFRGDSSLRTFLSAVVANLLRDYRDKLWGKWRPSAAAKRMGPLAVRLEVMVHRDRMPLAEAAALIRSTTHPDLTDRRAAEILAEVPERIRPRVEGPDTLRWVPSDRNADRRLEEGERDEALAEARAALAAALADLSDEDRTIVQLNVQEGLSVADVARALGIPQKPLYRRIPRILDELRRSPHLAGVRIEDILSS